MMRDCPDGAMRDLLPDYVHGTLPASEHARVAAHVAACADCAAEVDLILAARAAFPAPAVNVEQIVAVLVTAPGARGGAARVWGARPWQVAASVSFLLIGAATVITLRSGTQPARPVDRSTALPAVANHSQPSTQKGAKGFAIDGASELNTDQLMRLLREIDSVDVLPSTEPEPARRPLTNPPWEVIDE